MAKEKSSSEAVSQHIKYLASLKNSKDYPSVFVDWYSKLREENGFQVKLKSTTGDGGIDLVLEGPRKLILSQLKFNVPSREKIKEFNSCINSWASQDKFDSWVKNEVRNETNKPVYREAFRKAINDKYEVVWEFVCLGTWDQATFSRYQNVLCSGIPKTFEARLITAGRLNYYIMLQRLGAGPTEPLEIEIDKNATATFEREIEGIIVTTYICVMHLDSLIKKLRTQPDPHAFFARNVRILKTKSFVNDDIAETFKNDHESFFFDNNGISILCTEASFNSNTVRVEQPSIINGGQTINTILESTKLEPARVLARITQIRDSAQTNQAAKEFIDKMIFRSNSNNAMYPWDLRSNDECQVKIAKRMIDKGIFYERKQGEFRVTRPDVKIHIDSIRLAQNIVICNDDACGSNKGGPAWLKKIGKEPLFKTKENGKEYYYKDIFEVELNYDELIRQTFLFLALEEALHSIRKVKGIPGEFKRFKNASENFVYGIFWRAIKDNRSVKDLFYDGRRRHNNIIAVTNDMVKALFKLVEKELTSSKTTQNDIFRSSSYWSKAKSNLLSTYWKRRVSKAVSMDLNRKR